MKQKHLQGVMEHLELEVTSLSEETLHNMKQSMLSIGITSLTPEGLLASTKSIVSKLRKEVTDLEKEVCQLKEQNNLISLIYKEQEERAPKVRTRGWHRQGVGTLSLDPAPTVPFFLCLPAILCLSQSLFLGLLKLSVSLLNSYPPPPFKYLLAKTLYT